MQVNVTEAKRRLSQLIRAAMAGDEAIIANRGAPVVRLAPVERLTERRPNSGDARAILDWLERHKVPHHARRSAAEIDAAIAAERHAWD